MGTDIAVFSQEEIVGGVTLRTAVNLSDDSDLSRYWSANEIRFGTQLCRLWAERKRQVPVLPIIFDGILSVVPSNTFLFGVLALPLDFAHKQMALMGSHEDLLVPKLPIHLCHWGDERASSSEGKNLLLTYLRMGAKFLGPPAGNAEDRTVKVILGMHSQNVRWQKSEERYA